MNLNINKFWFKVLSQLLIIFFTIINFNFITAVEPVNTELDDRKNILIIHSYNQGFSWTDQLNQGIIDRLSHDKYNIYTEYLDSYRENSISPSKLDVIKSYSTKNIDYIIVTDNPAFDLILELKQNTFQDIPVLFAGVNGGISDDFPYQDVKGILQNIDYQAFLQWFNDAMPQVNDLLLCGAQTETTSGTFQQLQAAYESLSNPHFKLDLIESNDYDAQLAIISQYNKDTTAIYSSGSIGALEHDQYTSQLEADTQMPTFCGVSTSIGNHVIGGFVVSPYEHGNIIGDMILELSEGIDITELPIIEVPVQQKIFNFEGMIAYQLSEASLPDGSKIINRPETNITLSQTQMNTIIFIIVLLIVIISALLIVMKMHNQTNEKLATANHKLSLSHDALQEKSQKLVDSQKELTENNELLISANQKISHLVDYDQVTEILNEPAFLVYLERELSHKKNVTLLVITLTNLNELVYRHGEVTYQQIMKTISKFLKENCPEKGILGISANNDFLITLDGFHDGNSELVKKIAQYFEKPIIINMFTVILKYKIGISHYPHQTHNFKELLYYSRLSIMSVIDEQFDNISVFSQTILDTVRDQERLKKEIDAALAQNAFLLHFQPKIAPSDQCIVGLEALVRWRQADGSLKYPGYFIDIAELSGQILSIDYDVLELACQAISRYQLKDKNISIAVNLSGQHFASRDIVNKLMEVTQRYQITPELLEIEITETALIKNKEYGASILNELRNQGFTISLDDFGSGYASIDYLKTLPIDKIKIDQQFAHKMEEEKSRKLLKTMIQLAHELSLKVTVEGIETSEQFETIKIFGPDELQGYFFSKPAAIEEFFEA